MYSRFSSKNEKPIQIPEHYSGCAFSTSSKRPASLGVKQPPTFLDVATPTPAPPLDLSPPEPREDAREVRDLRRDAREVPRDSREIREEFTEQNVPAMASVPVGKDVRGEEKATAPVSIASPFSALFGNIGHAFPFSHGIGFEELLLLGLIVLLSRNEGESDVILLLGLLLFCG